jgi:hypothetical protein
MGYDDERSQVPRQLIEKTRAKVLDKHIQLKRARRPHTDLDMAAAAAELHDWTMLYWEHLKRFRNDSRLEERWQAEPLFEYRGEQVTLGDLADYRLSTVSQTERAADPETMASRTTTREEPWTLPPAKTLRVIDALDDCTNALGFDAKPDRTAEETGAGLDKDPDAEQMEHLNAEVNVDVAGD